MTEISESASLHAVEAPSFGSLASGVALTFAARLLILGSALASSVIVARWLGPAGTGALAVLNVTTALAMQFGSAGIPSATTYFVARDRNAVTPVWTNGMIFSLGAGLLIAIGIIALANFQPTIFKGVSARLIAIVAISIPFQLVTLLGLNLLLAIDRIRLMNSLDALSSVLLFVNSIVVLIIWQRRLTMLVSVNTIIAAVVCGLLVWSVTRVLRRRQPAAQLDLSLLKRMLHYGLKFYISIFAMFVIFRADLLIVNRFRGADAAGVYAIASQFTFLLIMLPGVIASLLFPRVAARQDETAAYAVDVTRHTSFVMLIVCLAAAGAAFALPLVYGAQFGDATIQLLIMLPGVFLISLESVLVQHFTGTGLPAIIPAFWVVTMLANVGLNLAFVPRWGARAAAVNSTVSYALICVLVAAYFSRRTGHNPFVVFAPRASEFRNLFSKLQRRAFAK
ncbi:MAG TPA: oligosaccharide flippase family protein [Pyrinomonadaceae bacterium]|jgi:O-antigen/teichoic acid export membrane protein|nr:oligosaccharide flippase family protein [Pyrinomonadaceae bacterium]